MGTPVGILFWGGGLTFFDPCQFHPRRGGLRIGFFGQAGGVVLAGKQRPETRVFPFTLRVNYGNRKLRCNYDSIKVL
jgi:hypothetical protein